MGLTELPTKEELLAKLMKAVDQYNKGFIDGLAMGCVFTVLLFAIVYIVLKII